MIDSVKDISLNQQTYRNKLKDESGWVPVAAHRIDYKFLKKSIAKAPLITAHKPENSMGI
jgi:hypothetical protein